MLVRFLSCRERFRLRYILGLEPHDKWVKTLGYGNMWHVCEEAHAGHDIVAAKGIAGAVLADNLWKAKLLDHTNHQFVKYPFQREEIEKWYRVCMVQFPEYIKYWSEHSDVKNRIPLEQEQVFDVAYTLPSGRVVRLRGKRDSVDLITDDITGPDGGVYLQENKSKGDIDKEDVERQLKFDLQTMTYTIALLEDHKADGSGPPYWDWMSDILQRNIGPKDFKGVRYNVVRRPLSGGKGNISPHKGKCTKPVLSKSKKTPGKVLKESVITPAETADEFYERLRRDYIADDPAHWFFRVRSEVSDQDIKVFRETCLDPLLENLCWWYEQTVLDTIGVPYQRIDDTPPPFNYRTPFGVWSALEEGGSTEYDAYLATGSEAGLQRVETLFGELQ